MTPITDDQRADVVRVLALVSVRPHHAVADHDRAVVVRRHALHAFYAAESTAPTLARPALYGVLRDIEAAYPELIASDRAGIVVRRYEAKGGDVAWRRATRALRRGPGVLAALLTTADDRGRPLPDDLVARAVRYVHHTPATSA